MIPSKQRGVWITTMLYRVQDVVGTLFETTNLWNSIEEVHAALNSGEAREFFDVRTNRFNIKQDGELDNQENRENFEEASSMMDKLFECVKSTVQDNWSIQREEEDRDKQVGLNRSPPARKLKQRKLRRDGQLYSLL